MELSKEVHDLLDRIKKLSQQAQKNESYSNTPINLSLNMSHSYLECVQDEMSVDSDLILVENMDFTDSERWLYVSENSMVNPYTGDLKDWLRQDFVTDNNSITQFVDLENSRKFVDTRTFTRPKKRMSRPSLENFTEGCYLKLSDSFNRDSMKSSISEDLSSDQESGFSGPVQFKLSEPVYNSSFDRILATASESIDSFTNMSPPSLMNSLCSSTFTTLMDSGYVNQEVVPKNENLVLSENDNPNLTFIAEQTKTLTDLSLNDTYDMKKNIDSIYKRNENDLNSTFQKNNRTETPRYNLSNTSTFTKKTKGLLSNSFKASCPDINKSFQKTHDCSLDLTFQKLSDSQPNLTEDLKRTILNQSMELMSTNGEIYHSARSGSADSLDERSSSISSSSKDSGTKMFNMSELDALAKVQEERLKQAMSTPIKVSNRLLLLDGDGLSPIQSRLEDGEGYLSRSDSDLSDICVTARSGISKRNSPARSIGRADITHLVMPDGSGTRPVGPTAPSAPKPEVRHLLANVPTMIVKPMEVNRRMGLQSRTQSAPVANALRPKLRSGLPRPTIATGIPRPMSRIPGPRSLRPPSRPIQRQPQKTDWMDGCY